MQNHETDPVTPVRTWHAAHRKWQSAALSLLFGMSVHTCLSVIQDSTLLYRDWVLGSVLLKSSAIQLLYDWRGLGKNNETEANGSRRHATIGSDSEGYKRGQETVACGKENQAQYKCTKFATRKPKKTLANPAKSF